MGVFSKLKNIFYDEVEEPEADIKIDITPKKEPEVPKVQEIKISEPEEKEEFVFPEKKEEKPTVSERELFRSERTFNFTELEEEDLPPRRSVLDVEPRVSRREPMPEVKKEPEKPRVFKPSPVISPIYGILDKDYKREEVVKKEVVVKPKVEDTARTYDSVRRKAYGTLEDDLEDTLSLMNKLTPETIKSSVSDIEEDVKELEEKSNKIEELITKIEKTTAEISIGEIEDKMKNDIFEEEEEETIIKPGVSDKTMTDSTLEHDLFNLIDSMYDDKED